MSCLGKSHRRNKWVKFSLRYAGLEIFDEVARGDCCVLAVMMLTCRRKAWPVVVSTPTPQRVTSFSELLGNSHDDCWTHRLCSAWELKEGNRQRWERRQTIDLDAGEDKSGLYQLLLVSRCGVFICLFPICWILSFSRRVDENWTRVFLKSIS